MDLTIHARFLPYEDPEASLASWRDALGFEVRNDVGYGGLRWITVGPAGQPGTSIVLQPPAPPGCGVTDQERRTILEMMAKGTCAAINLATADLDGVFERRQAGGAPRGPGNPPHPSRARRRSVTATPITDNPEAGRTILRQPSGALGYVVHRAWAVVERPLGARSQPEARSDLEGRSQRGGGSQCRRDDDNTRTSPAQSNQRG